MINNADPAECGSADITSVIPAVIPVASSQTPVVVTHGSAGIGIPRHLSAKQGNLEICKRSITDGCGVTMIQLQSNTPGLIKLHMEIESGACLSRGSNVLVVPQEVAEEMTNCYLNSVQCLCRDALTANAEGHFHPEIRALQNQYHELVQGMGYVIEGALHSIQTGSRFGISKMLENVLSSLLVMDAYKAGEYLLKLGRDAGQPVMLQGVPISGDFDLRSLRENHVPHESPAQGE